MFFVLIIIIVEKTSFLARFSLGVDAEASSDVPVILPFPVVHGFV